jgi:hypothetical protein
MNIVTAMADPAVFGSQFRDASTWVAWRAFLAALFALPMTADELELYRRCTGRTTAPAAAFVEAWLVCGRRAGKSFILALVAVYLACFRDWRQYLGPGERGTIMVIAGDRKQARAILNFIRGLLKVPMLARVVESEGQESITLANRIVIEVHTASYKSTRGYSIIAGLADELAIWPSDDSAEPDYEVLAAVRPGMINIPGSMLLCASSAYSRRGALWDAHRKHFARDGDPILVWQADTRLMNPCVPQAEIDRLIALDPAKYTSEFGGTFRTDVESFINREAVEACVSLGVRERAPVEHVKYSAFTDPSGGAGSDSFTLAISHRDGDCAVLDLIREVRPKYSPESVVAEFAAAIKSYKIARVYGDRFTGDWCAEQFRKNGIEFKCADKSKSDLYLDLLPVINSRRCDLLDNDRLVNQIVSLERTTGRSGKDSIDHPKGDGHHDDIANAVAGAIGLALKPERTDFLLAQSIGPPAKIFNTDTGAWLNPSPPPSLPRPQLQPSNEAVRQRMDALRAQGYGKPSPAAMFVGKCFHTGGTDT